MKIRYAKSAAKALEGLDKPTKARIRAGILGPDPESARALGVELWDRDTLRRMMTYAEHMAARTVAQQ